MSRTGMVIQARMGSTRLCGKVLADVVGKPLLVRQIERLRLVSDVDRLIVATSDSALDDAIEAVVRSLEGVELWRGPEQDVLARFAGAASAFNLDVIGRVTGDCPLIDPSVVGRVLAAFRSEAGCDYASNCRPRSWPHGFDVEFVSRNALDIANAEATDMFDRQHVLVYIFTQPERFRCVNLLNAKPCDNHLRFTVDYQEDLDFVREIVSRLQSSWPNIELIQIEDLLRREPNLLGINRNVPAHESITDASQRESARGRVA